MNESLVSAGTKDWSLYGVLTHPMTRRFFDLRYWKANAYVEVLLRTW